MPLNRHPCTHHLEWQCHMIWVQQPRSSGKGRKMRLKWVRKHKWFYVRVRDFD